MLVRLCFQIYSVRKLITYTHPFHSKSHHSLHIYTRCWTIVDGSGTMLGGATGHMQALVAAAGGVGAQQQQNWPGMDK